MRKRLRSFFALFTTTILAFTWLATTFTVTRAEEKKPLLTIACITDLHNQQAMLTDDPPWIRGDVSMALTKIKEQEGRVDALLVGGDVFSDVYTTQAKIENLMDQTLAYTDALTPNQLWVSGNHDYNAGQRDGFNSANYYDYIMKDRLGELPDSEAYYETYQGRTYLVAYHYVVEGFDFIGLSTAHSQMAVYENGPYKYLPGALDWVEDKLAEIGTKNTVFLLAHFPMGDSNGISAANKGTDAETTERMREIFKGYPNLIHLYGHDHSWANAHIYTDTAQRVTQYDTNGTKLAGSTPEPAVPTQLGDDVVWNFIANGTSYQLQNLASGKYLGIAANLDVVDSPFNWTLGGSDGSYTLRATDASGTPYVYYSSGSGTFSRNSSSYATLDFYRKTGSGSSVAYHKVDAVEDGGEYVVVAGTNRALTNVRAPENAERMAAMEVVVNAAGGVAPPEKGVWVVDQAGPDYYSFYGEGTDKYLGFEVNVYFQPQADYDNPNRVQFTVAAGGAEGSFRLYPVNLEGGNHTPGAGLYRGSSGWSINNSPRDLVFYQYANGAWVPVSALNQLTGGSRIMITEGGSNVMLAESNEGDGNARRMINGALVTAEASLSSKPGSTPPVPGDPGFTTAFIGSMRYTNTTIDTGSSINNRQVVQGMMIYVYEDEIVLQIKNYGARGADAWEVEPFVIQRDVAFNGEAPVFTSTELPEATEGAPYYARLATTGTGLITCAVTGGSLPAGVTLSPDGILSGTPTVSGSFPFTVTATGNAGSATKELTVTVRSEQQTSQDLELLALFTGLLRQEEEKNFTPASWQPFAQALATANALLDDPDNATPREVEEALDTLFSAYANLVRGLRTDPLESAIRTAKLLVATGDNYIPLSLELLQKRLAQAEKLLENESYTLEALTEMTIQLTDAISMMFPRGDKTGLTALIRAAERLHEAYYTGASWANLTTALTAAKKVADDPNTLQDEVAAAYENLSRAVSNLVASALKSGLETAIKAAEIITANPGAYVPATIADLAEELVKAHVVYNNQNASQAQVDIAQNNLMAKVLAARKRPNKDLLRSALGSSGRLSANGFTSQALADAMSTAEAVLADEEATRQMVDQATAELELALGEPAVPALSAATTNGNEAQGFATTLPEMVAPSPAKADENDAPAPIMEETNTAENTPASAAALTETLELEGFMLSQNSREHNATPLLLCVGITSLLLFTSLWLMRKRRNN